MFELETPNNQTVEMKIGSALEVLIENLLAPPIPREALIRNYWRPQVLSIMN